MIEEPSSPAVLHSSPSQAGQWDFLALVGPTASGKTKAAMTLGERYRIELISMDSALVYQGMDIGTAKPSALERQAVRHHLIDILQPEGVFSAADFANAAQVLIGEIQSRGAIPVVVGGTFLYFKALVNGLDDLPPAEPVTRAKILAEAEALGWPKMHEKLLAVDPVTAKRLAPRDSQRIARALEVWALTGQRISAFQSKYSQDERVGEGGLRGREHLGFAAHTFSFEPQERAWLHANIELRFQHMLKQGFLKESFALFKNPLLNASMPSMRCVGYRQAWVFWQAIEREWGELPPTSPSDDQLKRWTQTPYFEDFVQTSIAATRQLAKRQLTWLRSMKERVVLACDAPDFELQVQNQLDQAIMNHESYQHMRLKKSII
jgi:tRNA dimethylallyltransferase